MLLWHLESAKGNQRRHGPAPNRAKNVEAASNVPLKEEQGGDFHKPHQLLSAKGIICTKSQKLRPGQKWVSDLINLRLFCFFLFIRWRSWVTGLALLFLVFLFTMIRRNATKIIIFLSMMKNEDEVHHMHKGRIIWPANYWILDLAKCLLMSLIAFQWIIKVQTLLRT